MPPSRTLSAITHRMRNLLSEPLAQFLVIGTGIFMLDIVNSSNEAGPNQIVINDNKIYELADDFLAGRGRNPSAKEMDNLIVKWSQNEILFREAKKLELDNGDEMIRSRLILKIRNILFNKVVLDAPPEDELKNWFEENKSAYEKPSLYSFEQFPLEPDDQRDLGVLLQELATGSVLPVNTRYYQHRPLSNIASIFGQDAAEKLIDQPMHWHHVQSQQGSHIARITEVKSAEPITFEVARNRVIQDWKKMSSDLQLADQTHALAKDYHISFELSEDAKRYLDDLGASQASVHAQQHTLAGATGP